mmetsp:Transcript_20654/g.30686  ORF Transcript_20654/g.30686 Transcript_20654/m.30686 type:complete len:351 (+) Transcript_20654:165-1217(+)
MIQMKQLSLAFWLSVAPLTLETIFVWKDKDAMAVQFVVLKLARVCTTIVIFQGALAVHLMVEPATFVRCDLTHRTCVCTLSIVLAAYPLPVVLGFIPKFNLTVAMRFIFQPCTFVGPTWRLHQTIALTLATNPSTFIRVSTSIVVLAFSMTISKLPQSFVATAISHVQCTFTMKVTIHPRAFIHCAIGKTQCTSTFRLVIFPVTSKFVTIGIGERSLTHALAIQPFPRVAITIGQCELTNTIWQIMFPRSFVALASRVFEFTLTIFNVVLKISSVARAKKSKLTLAMHLSRVPPTLIDTTIDHVVETHTQRIRWCHLFEKVRSDGWLNLGIKFSNKLLLGKYCVDCFFKF